MAVDPKDFVGDLVQDGTDTLIDIDQANTLDDQDVLSSPLVENSGNLDQDVDVGGGIAISGNGATNAGGIVTVGDDLELNGHAAAAADATAAARAFTQDIETGSNAQQNSLNVSVVGSNVSVNDAGEDDLDNGDPDAGSVTQLGPDGPIGGALSGLAFPADGTGTDTEFHVSQSNSLNDEDQVTNAQVVNNDSSTDPAPDVSQIVTATGGDATSGIGIDIDGLSLLSDSDIGDDLSINGTTEASADALAGAEAFTQVINVGDNVQINDISASVIGANQNLAATGDDDFESVDLVSDNEDDTETFFGEGPNGDGIISQANILVDNESGANAIINPLVHNDANPSAEVEQVVSATGGNATTDDGIDTDGTGDALLSGVDVGDNLTINGSAIAYADAAATAEAFTQNITSGDNAQLNSFAASVVSGSQNIISVGEDNAGDPGFSPATLSPQDSVVEDEDTDTRFNVSQSNDLSDNDTIENAEVLNGDGPDGGFDGGAFLDQTATALGGTANADDGIDADGLGVDAISVGTVGDDVDISGSSSTKADATADLEAFTQTLSTGGNTQINAFAAEIIGGSQTTISVGEDDVENLAQVISEDGATVTAFDVTQSNVASDEDIVNDPLVFNDAGSVVNQTADATGGTADSDDGITVIGSDATFISSAAATIEDDLSVSGAASAHADALASAEAFTQNISTGGNGQLNDFNASVVGASQNAISIDGDNAGDVAGANSPLAAAGDAGPTITDVNLSQTNDLSDSDNVNNAEVLNDYDPGLGGGGSGSLTQTVTATGGTAPGVGFSGDAAGIDAEGLGGPIASVTVGDDASISGSTEATTDAIATAEAFTQTISTGSNTQVNSITASVVGGNQNSVATGEDDAEGVDLAANADGETSTSLGNFMFEDGAAVEDDPITQMNILDDTDAVLNPSVVNEAGGTVNQTVSATGGDATTSDGITLGDTAEIVDVVGSIGDDLDITGSASSSADALAFAESFTQDILVGGNIQLNEFEVSVVGGSENTYSAGDDDGGSGADNVDPGFVPLVGGLVEGTNTQVNVEQTNSLNDADMVLNPQVINAGGPGVPEGVVLQDADAQGGTSLTGDGIGGDAGDGSLVTGGLIGDDLNIDASTTASADATAALEAFTQDIVTGGNAQFNTASVSIVGGNSSTQSAGEDDTATGTLDIGEVNVLGGTDTQLNIEQTNGGPDGAALDNDTIIAPLVSNQSAGVGGDQGLEQDANAMGGDATAGSGIDSTGGLVNADIGDDGSVSGLAQASADAAGLTEGFSQDLSTGVNRQINSAEAVIVGANQNANITGGDDVAGGDDTAIGGVTGDADSLFIISQGNNLNDMDSIQDPTVESNGGDTVQNATSTGGTATAANGVAVTGTAGSGEAGDDFSINGETIASADAISNAEVFSQDIGTGGNVQANAATASVVGLNDSLFFTGEDDGDDMSDLPALSALVPTDVGEPDGEFGSDGDGVDTTFDITQVNALIDNDMVSNPTVISFGFDSDTVQNVTAIGGDATTGDGVLGGDGGLFDGYAVLDDLSIEGISQASASAYGVADAFTQNIVLGANVQVNSVDVSVVGGSTAVNLVGEDDIAAA